MSCGVVGCVCVQFGDKVMVFTCNYCYEQFRAFKASDTGIPSGVGGIQVIRWDPPDLDDEECPDPFDGVIYLFIRHCVLTSD